MKKIKILGVNFSNVTMREAVNEALAMMEGDASHAVFTPNPEIVMMALKNDEFKQVLNDASMVVPDGIGVVWASKYFGERIMERVGGFDLVQNVFAEIKKSGKSVYFVGGAPGVSEGAAKAMREKHPGLNIVGVSDGFFKDREAELIAEVGALAPDLLLVGTGAPRQEFWITENMQKLNAKVCIGVGGSFDAMNGNVKRAPQIFIKLNLEWFYRLVCQPSRFIRMLQLPKFVFTVWFRRGRYK